MTESDLQSNNPPPTFLTTDLIKIISTELVYAKLQPACFGAKIHVLVTPERHFPKHSILYFPRL